MSMSLDKLRSISFESFINASFSLPNGKQATGPQSVRRRRYTLVNAKFNDWKLRPAKEVRVLRFNTIQSLEELKKPISFGTVKWIPGNRSLMLMKRSEHAFAQGCSRVAYEAQLSKSTKILSLPSSRVVTKVFLHVGGGRN